MLLVIGALSIVALIVALIVFGLGIGGIVVLWNSNVVPFWNTNVVPFWHANAAIIEPPLATVIVISLWIYFAIKLYQHVRQTIATFSLANDTTFQKFMFFIVGGPTILIMSGFTVAAFAIPIVYVYQQMTKWWVVISAT